MKTGLGNYCSYFILSRNVLRHSWVKPTSSF